MPQANLPTSAPSAAPAAAAPASPVAPVTPAPVAAAPETYNLSYYAEKARQHIAGELDIAPASTPPPAPEPTEPVNEPSPEPTEPTPAEPASPEPEPTAEGDEPTADEMASWTDGEKRLHGALVKEREESKQARKELRELKEQIATLQRNPTQTPPPVEPEATAAQPAAPVATPLDSCQTFEQVDAQVVQAARFESEANRLQQLLNRNGVEPVIDRLQKHGVEKIGNVPIAEASADEVGEFLATVYENARTVQANAETRKGWIAQNQTSLAEAVKLVPELNDAKSAAYQAAVNVVRQNPLLRHRSDWPVIVAKLWLGEQAIAAKTKPATPAAQAPKPQPRPAAKPAPGAPRTSVAAIPAKPASTALAEKIANGTATMAEVQQYALGHVMA